MLSANKEKLDSYFTGPTHFVVPFFQRSYVWGVDNWNELWDNIIDVKDQITKKQKTEHFIGTIIVKQKLTEEIGSIKYDLVDGQQRLTTLCLLIRALYDTCQDASLKEWIYPKIIFKDSFGRTHIRIEHSRIDKEYFSQIMLSKDKNSIIWQNYKKNSSGEKNQEHRIIQAYCFFREQIEAFCQSDEDIRKLTMIILNYLPVINMTLTDNDDVQQIFDTINSLGVKLTTAELLKNHLYSNIEVTEYYDKYWRDIFEKDEDAISFWNADKTSGRIVRSTIEMFLYSFLVIKKESSIRLENLFNEFKHYLKDRSNNEIIEFAKEIKDYANIYAEFPDGENLVEIGFKETEKRFFHIINGFEITTILPLVLLLYKVVKDQNELNSILEVLESYIVRRTVCKLTTKNYNNLFISLIKEIKKEPNITSDLLKEKLLKYKEDTNRFPNNDEFKQAFLNKNLINRYSLELLYCISLFNLSHKYQDDKKLNMSGLTVEHLMPKKWRNNWPNPTENTEFERDSLLLTLGNLTLVQGRLNSSMRDSTWETKKTSLKDRSRLNITTDYIDLQQWNEFNIQKRGSDLFDIAIQIWKI